MDMLRWILLVVGLLVIAGLFGYYRWQERRAVRPQRRGARGRARRGREEQDVEAALRDMDDFVLGDEDEVVGPPGASGDEHVGPARASAGDALSDDDPDGTIGPVRVRQVGAPDPGPAARPGAAEAPAEPEPVREPAGPSAPRDDVPAGPAEAADGADDDAWNLGPVRIRRPAWARERETGRRDGAEERADDGEGEREAISRAAGEKIVVLHVHAGEGLCFTADAVREALETTGLRFGQHGIFHRHMETRRGVEPLFSVASMVKPGTLDPDDPETLETPGLALFLQLPGPFDGLSAFEQMLEVARRLEDQLDGHLLDGNRCELTHQAVEHVREDLREYRRLAHLAARRHHA